MNSYWIEQTAESVPLLPGVSAVDVVGGAFSCVPCRLIAGAGIGTGPAGTCEAVGDPFPFGMSKL